VDALKKDLLHIALRDARSRRDFLTPLGLLLGIVLLLSAVQLYADLQFLLHHNDRANAYDYLVINKRITNRMMGGSATGFSVEDLEALRQAPGVEGIAPVLSNTFPLSASNAGDLGFYTQLFFESLPDSCLDVQPEPWTWEPGQSVLPVVLSTDFLNLYNFGFAMSQGLPQLSEESVKALSFEITIGEGAQQERFRAQVAGFSRRFASVLVPQNFMTYANEHYGQGTAAQPGTVVLMSREGDHPSLTRFLNEQGYQTRGETLPVSKLKPVLHGVIAGIGALGLFVVLLAGITLLLVAELRVSRQSETMRLLATIGYAPSVLRKPFVLRPLRTLLLWGSVSLLLLTLLQRIARNALQPFGYELPPWPHPLLVLLLMLLIATFALVLFRRVSRLIHPLY
jgi:hypothetical protein